MTRVVTVKATYAGDPDQIFRDAIDLSELQSAMSDIATYSGMPTTPLTQGMTITTNVKFWGWLRVNGHTMHLEMLDLENRRLQSREHAPDVRQWDHLLSVDPHETGAIWTDQITLYAGWKTYIVALFCRYMYVHRHKRRNAVLITASVQPLRKT